MRCSSTLQKFRDNPYGNAPLRAVNLSPGIVTGTCRCTPVLMLLAFSHVEQSMEFPRYAFLVTPYLGGLVKSICDAILGVSLGLVAVSYLAEQWLNRSKKSKMEMCPRIGDFEGNTMEFFFVVLGCFGVQ